MTAILIHAETLIDCETQNVKEIYPDCTQCVVNLNAEHV